MTKEEFYKKYNGEFHSASDFIGDLDKVIDYENGMALKKATDEKIKKIEDRCEEEENEPKTFNGMTEVEKENFIKKISILPAATKWEDFCKEDK